MIEDVAQDFEKRANRQADRIDKMMDMLVEIRTQTRR